MLNTFLIFSHLSFKIVPVEKCSDLQIPVEQENNYLEGFLES